MSNTVVAWLVAGGLAAVLAAVLGLARWRAQARRAHGPRGVGEALEHGRKRVRDIHRDG